MSGLNKQASWAMLTHEERKKLRHDLRGSLCVLGGFHEELREALVQMNTIVDGADDDQLKYQMMLVFKNDIDPCLMFLEKTATRIHVQLDTLQLLCHKNEQ